MVSSGAQAERIGQAGVATVSMSWRYGGVDVVNTLWVEHLRSPSGSHDSLRSDAAIERQTCSVLPWRSDLGADE